MIGNQCVCGQEAVCDGCQIKVVSVVIGRLGGWVVEEGGEEGGKEV